jgi:DNA-binding MarR family transcriptional regulator
VATPTDGANRPRRLLRWPSYAMGQLHRLMQAHLDAELQRVGLSLRTYQVLSCLHEFGQVSQQQVCDAILCDRGEMVRLIDRLERAGYAERDRDTADRRKQRVTLTPAGQQVLRRVETAMETVHSQSLTRLSEDERRALHLLTLKALGEEPNAT